MSLYLGLDCGGTKTRAMVTESDGQVVFDKRSGPANLSTTLWTLIETNLREALAGVPKVESVCGCFAGLLTTEQKEKVVAILRSITKCEKVAAYPDYYAGWEIAKDQGDLLVIAGTGVLICSERNDKLVKSGGGGILMGDHGSTTSIGRNALHHLIVTAPASGEDAPSPEFARQVKNLFGTSERDGVLSVLYESDTPAMLLSLLAKTVGEDAERGKHYALSAVDDSMALLANDVRHHLAAYLPKTDSGSIVLAGGLWKLSQQFTKRFHDFLGLDQWKLKLISQSPVHGACRLAMKIK